MKKIYSNKLFNVSDAADTLSYYGALDFKDVQNTASTAEYEYNENGALTRDRNRDITSITYDYSGYPINIKPNGRKRIECDYTSDGRKLSFTQRAAGVPTVTDLYIDGLILRDGIPLMWQFDGGYVSLNANGTPASWIYYVQDHLGSTRLVVDSNNSTKETINYYPYGSEMTMTTPSQISPNPDWQPNRFTGKELHKQHDLNMYDFGARLFDVAGVPMWTSLDPLCEKYYHLSPYAYCAGDPVNIIDMNGDSIWIEAKNGRYLYDNGKLYNSDGSEYSGKMKGFVKDAFDALNIINNFDSGKDCLKSLSASKHSVVINYGENNYKVNKVLYATILVNNPDKDPSIFKEVGSGGIISWDPYKEFSGPSDKDDTRPAFIGLGHELGHAMAADKGVFDMTPYNSNHPDKELSKVIKDELIHAMPFENKLRGEARIPLRKAYARDSKGNLFMPIK